MAQGQAGPAYRATPLLETLDGRRSWLETQLPKGSELPRIMADVFLNQDVARDKQLRSAGRTVGVAVSEGEAGRLVVVGNGFMASDRECRPAMHSGSDEHQAHATTARSTRRTRFPGRAWRQRPPSVPSASGLAV